MCTYPVNRQINKYLKTLVYSITVTGFQTCNSSKALEQTLSGGYCCSCSRNNSGFCLLSITCPCLCHLSGSHKDTFSRFKAILILCISIPSFNCKEPVFKLGHLLKFRADVGWEAHDSLLCLAMGISMEVLLLKQMPRMVWTVGVYRVTCESHWQVGDCRNPNQAMVDTAAFSIIICWR